MELYSSARITGYLIHDPKRGNRQEFDQFTAVYEAQTSFREEPQGRAGVEVKYKAGQVEPGFSGGPLLNLKTCRVMGVVNTTRGERTDLGGWAIDVSVVERLLRQCGQELPSVAPGWTTAETKQQSSPGTIQLTPEQLRQLIQNPEREEQVERLSQSLGANQTAIRLALRTLGEREQQISDENLALKLIESIQAYETQLQGTSKNRKNLV